MRNAIKDFYKLEMTYRMFDVKRFAAQYLVKLVMSLLEFQRQEN